MQGKRMDQIITFQIQSHIVAASISHIWRSILQKQDIDHRYQHMQLSYFQLKSSKRMSASKKYFKRPVVSLVCLIIGETRRLDRVRSKQMFLGP